MRSKLHLSLIPIIFFILTFEKAQAVAVGPMVSYYRPRDIEPVFGPGLRVDLEFLPVGVDLNYWTSQYADNANELKARNAQIKGWAHLPILLFYIGGGFSLNRFKKEYVAPGNRKVSERTVETGYHGLVGTDLNLGIGKVFGELDASVITGGINTIQLSVGMVF